MRLLKIAFFTLAVVLIAFVNASSGKQGTSFSSGALRTSPGYTSPTMGPSYAALIASFHNTQYPELKGDWRAYSARIYYDKGGGGTASRFTQPLKLSAQGEWNFETSAGKFTVENINGGDWKRWGIAPYGPKRKIVLLNWNSSKADGPIEESSGRVNFIWVIYKVRPPVATSPGTVWIKFCH